MNWEQKKITRRSFVGGSAAIAALLGAGALSPAGANPAIAETPPSSEGEWIAAACWLNCGGKCVNKVLMKDGAVIRQSTDASTDDSFDRFQLRSCSRGRALQQFVFGVDRIKYPMKRAHWQPGGGANSNGALRGKDEWIRISWDEATDLIAEEINRIAKDYGPSSIIGGGANGMGPCIQTLLAEKGGFLSISDTSSSGTYSFNVAALGIPKKDDGGGNDRYDLKNADVIVQMGGNPVWSSGGSTMQNYREARDKGVEFVMVGPSYNPTAAWFDAKWIPVYPGTDTAFLLGVANEMVKRNVVDYDFLNNYTVGFDAQHMPEGAKLDENFLGYIDGDYDGVPKDAGWASKICGTPVEDIEWFAQKIGKDNKVMLFHNYALSRCQASENIPQLFMTIGAMGGHMGKSGHATTGAYKTSSGCLGGALVSYGDTGQKEVSNPYGEFIQAPLVWQSILDGKYASTGEAYSNEFKAKETRPLDCKMVTFEGQDPLSNSMAFNKGVEALRTVDFVVAPAYTFTPEAQYSDIILPLATEWEQVGGFAPHQRLRETVLVYTQVTEPLFEAKSDEEIGRMLAPKIGLDPDDIWPLSADQAFFNQIAGSTYVDENGDDATLVTITQEDIDARGVEGEPQQGVIGIDEFLANGCYTLPRSEGDAYSAIGYEDFVKDPVANPLKSESGKLEIYCQYKADTLNSMGYDEKPIWKPYANYVEPTYGREGTFKNRKIGEELGEYPFLVFNTHYYRGAHRMYSNDPWLKEAWVRPVFVSAEDARTKGIETGDTVRIYNQFGSVLRQASVLETIMPGCTSLPHGGYPDFDADGNDKGGTDNVLCGPVSGGMCVSGYNNFNCNFELYKGEQLAGDVNVEPAEPKMSA